MMPLLALLPVVEKLFDKFIPDPQAKAKALLELKKEENQQALQEMTLALQADQGQMEINKTEAASASVFVSGWRPWLGWVCGTAFAYHFVLQPLLAFLMASAGHKVVLPMFDMEALNTVLFGMLGLGGMRTYEKTKGVTK
jgi:hypothetical protein